jgi:hypothetical protein
LKKIAAHEMIPDSPKCHLVAQACGHSTKGGVHMHRSTVQFRSRGRVLLSVAVALLVTAAFVGAASAAGSGPSATGSGHFSEGGALRTFSFSAITHADGTVSGNAEINNRGIPNTTAGTSHIAIDCLQVVGNTAYVSGTITDSTVPGLVGDSGVFSVQDNGEGSNSPPDLISLASFYLPFPQLCQVVHPAPTISIDAGNVQIHS